MKTSHTFYTIYNWKTSFYGRCFCGLDIATNYPNVRFVSVILLFLILFRYQWKVKIGKDCLLRFSWSCFFGRRPTEYLKEGVVVQWLPRFGFDLNFDAFLRHKSFLHIVSLHPAVYKWVVSLDKARGTKIIYDLSSYEVCILKDM